MGSGTSVSPDAGTNTYVPTGTEGGPCRRMQELIYMSQLAPREAPAGGSPIGEPLGSLGPAGMPDGASVTQKMQLIIS